MALNVRVLLSDVIMWGNGPISMAITREHSIVSGSAENWSDVFDIYHNSRQSYRDELQNPKTYIREG
jgi:hypothetical protein